VLAGVPYAERIKLKAIVAQGWKDSGYWDLCPHFLNIQGLHNLCYISLTSWEDTPNYMLEDSSFLTQKAAKFFLRILILFVNGVN